MVVQGEWIADGFIVITDADDTRYAVRQHAIAVVHDADECRDTTPVRISAGCRASARPTGCFDYQPRTLRAICRCLRHRKGQYCFNPSRGMLA